jgi:hypothetical protein
MTEGALHLGACWAYKFVTLLVPFALFSQFVNLCLLALDSSQAFWLRFEGHDFVISEDVKKIVAETKLAEEEKLLEEKTVGFVESIAKTNTEKITKEILEGLSEDTDDSDNNDVESGGEDSEDRPWRPSHAVFGKSTIKQSHLDNMRGRYFRDMSIVRADVDRAVPAPEENEVVIF